MSQGRRSGVWVTAALVALACSALPASDAAAGTWSAPITVSPEDQFAEKARVAINERGDVAVAWRNSVDSYHSTIELSVKPVGHSFSAPLTISTNTTGQTKVPAVALGPEGQVIVVWEQEFDSEGLYGERVMFSSGSLAGAGFSAPTAVSDYEGGNSGGAMIPDVAIDGHGAATAVWAALGGGGFDYATHAPGADGFSAPGTVTNPGDAMHWPLIALAHNGAAVVTWTDYENVYAVVREAGHPFGAAQILESAPCVSSLDYPAINEAGQRSSPGLPSTPHAKAAPWGPGRPIALPGSPSKLL